MSKPRKRISPPENLYMNPRELENMKQRLLDLEKKFSTDHEGHSNQWKDFVFLNIYQVHILIDLINCKMKDFYCED